MDPTPTPDLPALYRAAVETGDAAELLPREVFDAEGRLAATRPLAHDPPPRT